MKFDFRLQEARIEKLRNLLDENLLEAVLLTSRENNRYFANFTGTTSICLLTDKVAKIYVDSRYIEQAKVQCGAFEAVLVTRPVNTLMEDLAALGVKKIAIEDEDVTISYLNSLKKINNDLEYVSLSSLISKIRYIKDEFEIEQLKIAAKLADNAFNDLLKFIKVGMKENELAAYIENHMRMNGASAPSFDTIVASGYRSAMPHGVASDKVIESGDIVTIDFGCIYNGYCSDTTRTIFVGEVKNEKLFDIYNVVLEAHLKAEQQVRAGMTGQEADTIARDVIKNAGYGEYFGHSLGHSTGLLVHELPSLSQAYKEKLPVGSMVTIEPGIYIAGLGGVRIEDSCLVHEDHLEPFNKTTKDILIINN